MIHDFTGYLFWLDKSPYREDITGPSPWLDSFTGVVMIVSFH